MITSPPVEAAEPLENTVIDFACLEKRSRAAQREWRSTPLQSRERVLRDFTTLLAGATESLSEEVAKLRHVSAGEALVSEVAPLLAAAKFLGRETFRRLKPLSIGRSGRPVWLAGVRHRIERKPHGLVLVIAPGNYPVFLAGTQVLQAIAAGNVVWCKPAPGAETLFGEFKRLLLEAGLPADVLQVLPASEAAARAALRGALDLVVFTGSSGTGRKIMATLAERNIPSIMELSGVDASFIRADADLELAARALAFGITLNRGGTCIAPRRVFVAGEVSVEFTRLLGAELSRRPEIRLPVARCSAWLRWVREALNRGAQICFGEITSDHVTGPLVVGDVPGDSPLLREDTFAPVMVVTTVSSDEAALELDQRCAYGLGASIFSRDEDRARRLASRLRVGFVSINDVIAPSADPRIPFGGTGASGFGVTRGGEGLLALTVPRVISLNRSKYRRHHHPISEDDEQLVHSWMRFAYQAGCRRKFSALGQLLRRGRERFKTHSKQT